MYYESLEALARKYDRTPKQYAFAAMSAEQHRLWREKAARRLTEITGMEDCERTESAARRVRSEQRDGYALESWLMATEPDIIMPFYLLRPACPNGAAVLALHGHGGGKEMMIAEPSFAEELVREGFLVFCPDERGSGERRERFEQGDSELMRHGNSHRELAQIALGFGQALIGLAVWDLMRLVDLIETMPEVRDGRIGCVGFSGGGQQTLWLAALDERIRAAVTGGYFYGTKDSLLLMANNCACNYVPQMWKTMDMGDLGAMIAPRALWIANGESDPLSGHRGLENVYEQLEITKKAYALYAAEDQLVHHAYPGGHVWCGDGILEFLLEKLTV